MRARRQGVWIAAVVIGVSGVARADNSAQVYESMKLEAAQVLSGTVLAARVVPGETKQVVALVTYMTGKKDKAGAVNVVFEVFASSGETLTSIYSRDLGSENGGYVGQGDLQIVDLDGDGVAEIVVTYDDYTDALIEERIGEILAHGPEGLETIWSGAMKYDATRAARSVPEDRRDRYKRELDVMETLRTKGETLVMKKTVIAVAGERLPEPKVVLESYPRHPDTTP